MTDAPRSASRPIRPDAPSAGRRGLLGGIVAIIVIAVALLALAFWVLNDLLVDRLWFESVGQLAVWDLNTFARLLVWIPVTLAAFLLLTLSIWIAVRSAGEPAPRVTRVKQPLGRRTPMGYEPPTTEEVITEVLAVIDDVVAEITPRRLGLVLTGVAALLAVLIGLATSAEWQTLLLWENQATSAATGAAAAAAGPGATSAAGSAVDPVFGQPLTFYLFDMPFWRAVAEAVGSLLDALIVLTGIAYLALARRSMSRPNGRLWAWHLGILIALRIAIGAIGFQLDKFALALQQRPYPQPVGVNATDAAVRIPAADLLTILTIVVAVVVLLAIVRQRFTWAAGAFGAWAIVAVAAMLLALVNQALFVNPNPLDQERRFIANDITSTRLAYGLDRWQTRSYPATNVLTGQAIIDDAETFANARLWDYRPLGTTLDQLQTVRQYYDFTDVDIDRYMIDGEQRQVMLSAREMAIDRNPAAANWLNTHFVYTHGYGVAMVPVNGVQADGLPALIIRDMPVVSRAGAPEVTEPRIYFGERPSPWVVTGAQTDEFDYPSDSASGDVTTRWKGTTGIKITDGLNRLLLSIWTGDFVSFFTTPQITDESQFLMRRSMGERLNALAPFLEYDSDPYLVVAKDGRLVWIIDAYTTTNRYPLARSLREARLAANSAVPRRDLNYIRNAVKITIDAYDGTTRFYINDPNDPLIATWAAVYPTLFSPLSELPDQLDPHLRYPEGMFNVQTGMFSAYHVTEPTTFYQGDNLWTVPTSGSQNSQILPSEAYYVQMRLPSEADTEYLLIQPMVPARRPNMIAWIAARNDRDARGEVSVYQLPVDTSIFGPAQVEARIAQTPEIAAQITLWDQAGSSVIRGNLIVVPVGGSFVYLSPIYLQSTSSAFPQFTKIVVATPSKVVWADTLDEALRRAVGEGPDIVIPNPTPGPGRTPAPVATPGPVRTPGADGLPTDVNGLIRYANVHFEQAQQAMGRGDFEEYGREMALVQQALDRLAQLTGE
jgi:uncharacterized membrane protein (UPF0182 family)